MPTHEEWEDASRARDKCARLAVRALLAGRTAAALEYANQSDAWERTNVADSCRPGIGAGRVSHYARRPRDGLLGVTSPRQAWGKHRRGDGIRAASLRSASIPHGGTWLSHGGSRAGAGRGSPGIPGGPAFCIFGASVFLGDDENEIRPSSSVFLGASCISGLYH